MCFYKILSELDRQTQRKTTVNSQIFTSVLTRKKLFYGNHFSNVLNYSFCNMLLDFTRRISLKINTIKFQLFVKVPTYSFCSARGNEIKLLVPGEVLIPSRFAS